MHDFRVWVKPYRGALETVQILFYFWYNCMVKQREQFGETFGGVDHDAAHLVVNLVRRFVIVEAAPEGLLQSLLIELVMLL